MSVRTLASAALLLIGSPSIVDAQPPATGAPRQVAVLVVSCAEDLATGLIPQLEVEMRAASVSLIDAWEAGREVTRVSVVCHVGELVRLVVASPGHAESLRRELELTDSRDGTRVLALAIVEAVREAWARPADVGEAGVTPDELSELRRASAAERAALRELLSAQLVVLHRRLEAQQSESRAQEASRRERERRTDWSVWLAGALWTYAGNGAALVGPSLGGSVTLAGPLSLSLEVSEGTGALGTALGEVLLASFRGVGALELYTEPGPPVVGFAGIFGGLGWSWAQGTPDDPLRVDGGSIEALTGSVGLRAGALFVLAAEWSLFVRAEGGYGFGGLGVDVGGRRVTGTGGPLLALSIGARFSG